MYMHVYVAAAAAHVELQLHSMYDVMLFGVDVYVCVGSVRVMITLPNSAGAMAGFSLGLLDLKLVGGPICGVVALWPLILAPCAMATSAARLEL